jgi:hypothetical protein
MAALRSALSVFPSAIDRVRLLITFGGCRTTSWLDSPLAGRVLEKCSFSVVETVLTWGGASQPLARAADRAERREGEMGQGRDGFTGFVLPPGLRRSRLNK